MTLLCDDDELVRREAFETCTRLVNAGALTFDVLRDALDRATPGECANALGAWFSVDCPVVIGHVLASARREVRECALRMRPALARTDLAPLLGDDAELFIRLRHALRFHLFEVSLTCVLNVALLEQLDFASVEHVRQRVRKLDRLPPEQMQLLHKLAARCEAALAHDAKIIESDGELALCDDVRDDLDYFKHVCRQLLDELSRLIAVE